MGAFDESISEKLLTETISKKIQELNDRNFKISYTTKLHLIIDCYNARIKNKQRSIKYDK
jgi:hypothetical protein